MIRLWSNEICDINVVLESEHVKSDTVEDIMEYVATKIKSLELNEDSSLIIDVESIIDAYGLYSLISIVIGISLSSYQYSLVKDRTELFYYIKGISEFELQLAHAYIKEGRIISESICLARELTNLPSNYLNPHTFCDKISYYLEEVGLKANIIYSDDLKAMGMNGLYTVGMGSKHKSRLVIIEYIGDANNYNKLAIIGKGVTVDTGGYSLKASKSMSGIRGDMAGAASALGAVIAIAKMETKTNISVILPICENRISSDSYVPGDVITSYSGKLIEVLNTDAEGRIILADAISYARIQLGATHIVDIATLTGAVVSSLGYDLCGVISNSDYMWAKLDDACKLSGERCWRFPTRRDHYDMIKSDIADIKNTGGDICGTITAALFLEYFTEGIPWLHMDIAGTAWVDKPLHSYQSRYATGFGVSSLYYISKYF